MLRSIFIIVFLVFLSLSDKVQSGDFTLGFVTLQSHAGITRQISHPFETGKNRGEVVIIDPHGFLLVAVTTRLGLRSDMSVVRYLANADVDKNFGSHGVASVDLGGEEVVYGLGVAKNGEIILGGYTLGVDKRKGIDFALVSFTKEGKLNSSFGRSGFVTTDLGGSDEMHYLVLQPDGKIVAGGFTNKGGKSSFAVARYLPQGAIDKSFGSGGWVTNSFSGQDRVYGLALQRDKKIVVAGSIMNNKKNSDCAVARYQSDGILDKGFGKEGVVLLDGGFGDDVCSSLAIQKDNKIVVAGYVTNSQGDIDFLVGRVDSFGVPDDRFGEGKSPSGLVFTDFMGGVDLAHAVQIQNDGKIIAVGEGVISSSAFGKNKGWLMARYWPDGSLETDFGLRGKMRTLLGKSEKKVEGASATIFGRSGVAIVGHKNNKFLLVLYNQQN